MKRVLFTIPVVGGGMGRAVINFAAEFSRLGFEVAIFLLADSKIEQYKTIENIEVISGIRGKYVKYKFLGSLLKLRHVCKQRGFNYVFSFSGMHSSYVIMALTGIASKVFVFHRASPYKTYGKINDVLNSILFLRSSGLVVQTQTAKDIFRKKYKHSNIILVPNPVKEVLINNNQERENIVISISRLIKGKGLDILIKMFSDICRQGNEKWRLQIVGEGDYRKTLESHIKKCGMEDRIELVGFQCDVDHYLSKASIFAFTSESEGFPNALLEAMCSGLPCISFDCPTGPSEMIIDGENGFLVRMNDIDTYRKKLELLMNNQEIREKFSGEAIRLSGKYNSCAIIQNFIMELEKC